MGIHMLAKCSDMANNEKYRFILATVKLTILIVQISESGCTKVVIVDEREQL